MKQYIHLFFVAIMGISCGKVAETPSPVKLNQIQIIGSHNSYKSGIEPELMQLLVQEDSGAMGLDYRHLPLQEQLDLGLRNLELDVLNDPQGGQYQNPIGLKLMDSLGIAFKAYDTLGELSHPGLKTFHIPDIDFRSHCLTFKGCLSDIKYWSVAHPDHLPIIVTINLKNTGVDKPDFTEVIPFNGSALDSLDVEILSVFREADLVTPSMVQGEAANLRASIMHNGWPDLDAVRGKIMFVLDTGDDLTKRYLSSAKDGRIMFASVPEDHPEAGFFIINDPIKQEDRIRDLVKKGFMVRTRADANTKEARNNDYTRFEAAQRSGAQVITTDYYINKINSFTSFKVTFDSLGYERCNPVSAVEGCTL